MDLMSSVALPIFSVKEESTGNERVTSSSTDMSLCMTMTIGPCTVNLYSTDSQTSFNAS